MLKRMLICGGLLLSAYNTIADEVKYSSQKLENGASVICVNTNKIDSVMIAFCISAGSADEIETDGVANLLGAIFVKKLKEKFKVFKGIVVHSVVGYDQSIVYICCQKDDLENVIKCVAEEFEHLSFDDEDILLCKKNIKNDALKDSEIDFMLLRKEARSALYWHAKYGSDMSNVDPITKSDLIDYSNNFYKSDRITVVVLGNVSKNKVASFVQTQFSAGKSLSNIRLKEPDHHDSVVRITKISKQVNTPVIEMMWRVPCYKSDQKKAIAIEIFANSLEQHLKKTFVDDQGLVVSLSIETSLWNYSSGEVVLKMTLPRNADINYVETAVLAEIRWFDKLSKDQMDKAIAKICSDIPSDNSDPLYTMSWMALKAGAGNDVDFVKGYSSEVRKGDLDQVNSNCFKEPAVIAVLKPE